MKKSNWSHPQQTRHLLCSSNNWFSSQSSLQAAWEDVAEPVYITHYSSSGNLYMPEANAAAWYFYHRSLLSPASEWISSIWLPRLTHSVWKLTSLTYSVRQQKKKRADPACSNVVCSTHNKTHNWVPQADWWRKGWTQLLIIERMCTVPSVCQGRKLHLCRSVCCR